MYHAHMGSANVIWQQQQQQQQQRQNHHNNNNNDDDNNNNNNNNNNNMPRCQLPKRHVLPGLGGLQRTLVI